ncbi:hypothetical protein ZIOFF_064591 [Zingiber officinale]|uniref:Uncharacterized protein n=1 Tax=Zingiber officinale TaxID=94328 RepID=A0A8J5EY49_ZINOF|nr:hypothetical protein ZIOFF_064591 [Zingiber officinale]
MAGLSAKPAAASQRGQRTGRGAGRGKRGGGEVVAGAGSGDVDARRRPQPGGLAARRKNAPPFLQCFFSSLKALTHKKTKIPSLSPLISSLPFSPYPYHPLTSLNDASTEGMTSCCEQESSANGSGIVHANSHGKKANRIHSQSQEGKKGKRTTNR